MQTSSGENQTEDSAPNGRNLRSTVDPAGSIRLILSTGELPQNQRSRTLAIIGLSDGYCPFSNLSLVVWDNRVRPKAVVRRGAASSIRVAGQLPQPFFELIEIDRFSDEFSSAQFAGASAPPIVAIGGHHHHRQVGEALLDLLEKLQPVHSGHVDVRKDREQVWFNRLVEELKGLVARVGEMHHVGAVACFAAKVLTEQVGHIGLVIDNQDADAHVLLPAA